MREGVRRKSGEGPHTVKVLEVGQLDPLAHAKDVGRRAETVDQHPNVSGIERGDLGGSISAALHGMLDIGPRGDERTEDHETEREKGESRDGATEPQDFSIGNQDDGQVLEDGVHRNGEILKRLGAGVDHANQE